MTRLYSAVLLGVLLAGCAAMSDNECRSATWYEIGERDALVYGLRPQIDLYAEQCRRHGVEVSENGYLAGWFYGERERALRMSGAEAD